MKHYEVSAKTSGLVFINHHNQVDQAFTEFAVKILHSSLESGNKTLITEKKQTPLSLQ